jgi:putative membrane protein
VLTLATGAIKGEHMDSATGTAQKASLSDYLAAERTLLAWIRTGLALMGFGFVVARFGLFLQQLQFLERPHATASYGFSLWFGTALIGFGILVNGLAGWHHIRLVRDLDRGEAFHSRPTMQVASISFLLALVGLAMAIYLISIRS